MLSGYGKVSQSSQRQDKRNAAQRGFDRVQGIFSSPYVVTATLTSFPINLTNFHSHFHLGRQTNHQSYPFFPAPRWPQSSIPIHRDDSVSLYHEFGRAEEMVPV